MFSETSVFLTSGVVALFISLITSALQIAGIISINLARALLVIAWLVAVVGASASLNDAPLKHRAISAVITGIPVGLALLGIERWIVRDTQKQERALSFSQVAETIKLEPNIVSIAKPDILVEIDHTFYELKGHERLKDYSFYAAIVEFENQPISGRAVQPLDSVLAQIIYYDSKDKERYRVESGTWVGERSNHIALEIGRRKKLVVAFWSNRQQEVEVWAVQNNRDTSSLNLNSTHLELTDWWLRAHVRLIAHGEIINEEDFELLLESDDADLDWPSIKKLSK